MYHLQFYSSHCFQWIRFLILLHTFIAATSAQGGTEKSEDVLYTVNTCTCTYVGQSSFMWVYVYMYFVPVSYVYLLDYLNLN